MRYAQMPQHQLTYSPLRRSDGETFLISATLYETSLTMNYWRVHFIAAHARWGDMHFNLFIPKSLAPTLAHANGLAGADPLSQIHAELQTTTSAGRDLNWFPSPDGWHMVG